MSRLTVRNKGYIEIIGCKSLWPSKKSKRAHLQNAIIRLAEYEDTEEQGLLLRLPCKPGDTVYAIDKEGEIVERHIYDVEYRQTRYGTEVSFATATLWFPGKSIGETVFFTREEAERAIKEGGSNV